MRSSTPLALRLSGAALAAILGAASTARGGGISLQDFDGKALGMSNAFAATADNPSAVFFNPAGIAHLDGLQGEATLTLVMPDTEYRADPGQGADEDTRHVAIPVPALFGTAELTDWLAVGFGTFVPFGLSIDWGRDWSGRYIIDEASIQVVEHNLNVATKVPLGNDMFIALAAGGSLVTADAEIKRALDQRVVGAPDAQARIILGTHGSHIDTRWNVAFLLSLFDRRVRLGASYRDAIHSLELSGRAEFFGVAPAFQTVFPRGSRSTALAVLPNEVRAGLAVDPIEDLTLELDYKWTNWSVVPDIQIKFRSPDGTGRSSPFRFQWDDTSFVALGAEYRLLKNRIGVRAGVFWDEAPSNRETLNPALPDGDRRGFSVGVGVKPIENLFIDVGYLFLDMKTVVKNNDIGEDPPGLGTPSAEGRYHTQAHLVSFTVGLKF